MREYGRQLAMDGLLSYAMARRPVPAVVTATTRPSFLLRYVVPVAAAASVSIAFGVWRFMPAGARNEGSLIETGERQTLELRFAEENTSPGKSRVATGMTTVDVASNTRLRVFGGGVVIGTMANVKRVKATPGKVLLLESGSIRLAVARQPEGRSLVVRSPQAEIRVVGTKFAVNSDGRRTRVDVSEGTVRVRQVPEGAEFVLREELWATVADGKAVELSDNAIRQVDEFPVPGAIWKEGGTPSLPEFAFDGRLLWLVNPGKTVLYSVNPETRSIQDRVDLSATCGSLTSVAADGTSLWGFGLDKQGNLKLYRINAAERRCEEIEVPGVACGGPVACGGGSVWLSDVRNNVTVISRFDPVTRRVVSSVAFDHSRYGRLASVMWFDDGLWLMTQDRQEIVRIDPADGTPLVRSKMEWQGRGWLRLAGGPDGKFWALNPAYGRIMRFESLTASEWKAVAKRK